jgi:cation transport ATPase
MSVEERLAEQQKQIADFERELKHVKIAQSDADALQRSNNLNYNEVKGLLLKISSITENSEYKIAMIIQDMNKEQDTNDKRFKLIFLFAVTIFLSLIASAILVSLPTSIVSWLEWVTSRLTLVLLACIGVLASFFALAASKRHAVLTCVAYAVITACYGGYVINDFGASHPEVAAFGFNVATMLMLWSAAWNAYIIKKRG